MSTNITYNTENADEKFREILGENDPRSFFSMNEPDSVVQNPGSLVILDYASDQTLWREMIDKGFRLLSSTIAKFEITNSDRFVYSELLATLLVIKKKTQINIHKQIIQISMLCLVLKVLTQRENTDDNTKLMHEITEKIFKEYTEYINNFPT